MNNAEIKQFFRNTPVSVQQNGALREPQIQGYLATQQHFQQSREPGYIQLPVGCGKTGLMGLTPFGIANGRVLIVTPNLTIRDNIQRELDISNPNCFYRKRGVLVPKAGPFLSELKTGANIHDCDAAHIVVGNIQQFTGHKNRWFSCFPEDYFDMILVDEGHHNVADTWRKMFEYFRSAKVVSYTATPMRSDGKTVQGALLYKFGYKDSMMNGFISQIDALFVEPIELTFTVNGQEVTHNLDEVMQLREHDWFSRGVALSEECNRSIVDASIRQLIHVRKYGSPRQLIAVACSIRHAAQIKSLYQERGYKVEVLHSQLHPKKREQVERLLREGLIDGVVQVNILGEGYDLPTLAIAAVFRPYRSLSPYVQFVGRILRLALPDRPYTKANHVYLVSHAGLNDDRFWSDFTNFDDDDQEFFREYLQDHVQSESDGHRRLTLRPFMHVINEVVEHYRQQGYLKEVDDVMVDDILVTIRERGFDPIELGLTKEMIVRRLMMGQGDIKTPAYSSIVQPQRRREALKVRANQESQSIADTVLNRFRLPHRGREFLKHFHGSGAHNTEVLIRLANSRQNKVMGIESGDRASADVSQFEAAIQASPDIVDDLSSLLREKLKNA